MNKNNATLVRHAKQFSNTLFRFYGLRINGIFGDTDFPAYSDTGYSDTPLSVTVFTGPKLHFMYQK